MILMSVAKNFIYDIKDIDYDVRKTNILLRALNSVRLSWRDIAELNSKTNFTQLFWTVIQLSRTYTSLRRLYKLIINEANIATSIIGLVRKITEPPIIGVGGIGEGIPSPDLTSLNVNVNAFLNNLPIDLNKISLMNLPEEAVMVLQELLEEEAEIIVNDARKSLRSQVINWTGFLGSSIGWMPQVDGVRVYADAYYGLWVEEGHRLPKGGFFEGYHYMRTATEAAEIRLPEKIRGRLNELIYNEP